MTHQQKIEWCVLQHEKVNHLYDGKSYHLHLQGVAVVAIDFIDLCPISKQDAIISCYGHDLIEDTRNTYNDVKAKLGEQVADVIYALTNEKGRNRAERANDKYYDAIRQTPGAVFVKLCDRIANVQYSASTKSKMLDVYRKENDVFLQKIFSNGFMQYKPMVDYLQSLLTPQKMSTV